MHDARPFELFTRLGFAARGLLYVLIGYLAVEAGRNTDSSGVLRMLAEGGASRLVLLLIAAGLLAYGAWRCADATFDLEGAGRGLKGAVERGGRALSGGVHVLLGLLALGLVVGLGEDGGRQSSIVGWVLDLPGGALLLKVIAAGLVLGGLAQAWSAYRLKFLKQLDAGAASRPWVKWAGRLGYLARGVVFVLIGMLLWQAAGAHDPQQAGGTGEALATLDGWQRVTVAIGLGLFGVFSMVQAVYRRITNPRVLERAHGRVARSSALGLRARPR